MLASQLREKPEDALLVIRATERLVLDFLKEGHKPLSPN